MVPSSPSINDIVEFGHHRLLKEDLWHGHDLLEYQTWLFIQTLVHELELQRVPRFLHAVVLVRDFLLSVILELTKHFCGASVGEAQPNICRLAMYKGFGHSTLPARFISITQLSLWTPNGTKKCERKVGFCKGNQSCVIRWGWSGRRLAGDPK